MSLAPFRTLTNNPEGKAYAQEHGEAYPFPNDYFDAPAGTVHPLVLSEDTACTGVILVGYKEPLKDHAVSCTRLVTVAKQGRVPIAVWASGGKVIQVSELYRP